MSPSISKVLKTHKLDKSGSIALCSISPQKPLTPKTTVLQLSAQSVWKNPLVHVLHVRSIVHLILHSKQEN